jgi:Recombinase
VLPPERRPGSEYLAWSAVRGLACCSQRGQFARGALYLMLQNRIYRGEIVHKERSYSGEHTPIIDQELWDMAITC